MSAGAVIAIAVGVAVVLGALAFLTLARRSDVRGAGALSGETRRRDRSAREARPLPEVEPADGPGNRGAGHVGAGAPPWSSTAEVAPVPWTPPDPEAIGVSRRMFFNRADRHLDERRPPALRRWLRRVPVADGGGRVRPGRLGRQARRHPRLDPHRGRVLLRASPAPGSPSTERRFRRPAPSTTRTSSPAWSRASWRSTRSARTSAACRPACDQPVVRVPVPRFAVQPRR